MADEEETDPDWSALRRLPAEGGCSMANARIGTSGWSYKHWHGGVFYPEDLKRGTELEFYAIGNAKQLRGVLTNEAP